MTKNIATGFIALSLFSMGANAATTVQNDIDAQQQGSYACKAMLERGSEMFCQKSRGPALQKVAAVSSEDKHFFACDAMIQRGSEMFCQKSDSYAGLKVTEVVSQSKRFYACDTMVQRGSEMFCKKESAHAVSHIK